MSRTHRDEDDDDILPDGVAIKSKIDTPPGVSFQLTPKQLEWWAAVRSGTYKYMAIGGAIRGTKTFTVLATLFLLMRMYPRSRWAVVRMDLPTLKRNTIPSIEKMRTTAGGWLHQLNKTDWEYTADNGSKLILFPESIEDDPELERFRGLEVNGFALEEANELQVKTKNKCIERAGAWIIPPDMDQSVAIAKATRGSHNAPPMSFAEAHHRYGPKQPPPYIFMTFNPADNWVRDEIYDPYEAGTLAPPWYYLPATIRDNPFITPMYLESLEELRNTDPDGYERFVLGKWGVIRAPNQLITSDLIANARLVPYVPGAKREGLDVARYGKDGTVFAGIDGNCLVDIEEHHLIGIDQSSTRLAERIRDRGVSGSNVTIDVVGLGGGVADNSRANGTKVNEFVAGGKPFRRVVGFRQQGGVLLKQRSFYKFADLWSQAWWEFREKLRTGRVAIRARHNMLVKDLTAPRYTITNKVIKVESSDDIRERIGRSPDVGVAVVLGFFDFPEREPGRTTSQQAMSRRRVG